MAKGEFFTTTGEVLLPEVDIASSSGSRDRGESSCAVDVPARFAEIVWGDGGTTDREVIELANLREFGI